MSNKRRKRPTEAKKQRAVPASPDLGKLQMSILNLRQMYEGLVQEKAVLHSQLQQSQALVASLLVSLDEEEIVVTQRAIDLVAEGLVEGLNVKPSKSPKGIKISLVWAPEEDEPDESPL